ncbi:Fanconi anemia group G protein isoform X1 [Chiloscyllium plagiosum]|uniref:Fanconi anemia group G protein isoform X1 n=1 Tax=Chiloscyllium plagiosum TaxID=36176 RepID=UPI001CB7F45B|nr:Fanconi anemia group G protein isoform X1 [Chiloscyllium plagiosum]
MESGRSWGCLEMWNEENCKLVAQLKNISVHAVNRREIVRQSHVSFSKLLEKIQGLPPTVSSIPLELTILYNTVVLSLSLSNASQSVNSLLYEGLVRGLEAYDGHFDEPDITKLWAMISQSIHDPTFIQAVDQLICLQCVLWLVCNQLEKIDAVLHILRDRDSSGSGLNTHSGNWWQWIKSGDLLKDRNGSDLMLVLSLSSLGELIYTCAMFIRGFRRMEESNYREAVDILEQAAEGLCSKRILAEIYTLIGHCSAQMDRPQTALQYFRWALQADIQCLSALYHAAMVYRQLEMVDAELEALNHLSVALDSWDQYKAGNNVDSQVLIRPEQLVQIPATCHLLTNVNWVHVKHLLARRFLQMGRFEDTAEHYLDLLASFLEESQREVFVVADHTIPRIPEIYLEAAVALLHCRRFNDVITVSEEIASKVTCLISENLTFEIRVNEWLSSDCSKSSEAPEINTSPRNCLLNGFSEWQILGTKKKETLNYILWSATAFLYQGQAFALLKNNKESITNFTRCINLLLKVQVVCPPDSGEPDDLLETLKENMTELKILQTLKSLAFTGRGIQLAERGQNSEALQNLQLSLQAYPDSFETIYHLVEVLWKLERKQEAVTFWLKKTEAKQRHKVNALKQIPLFVISCLKEINTTEEEAVSKKLEEYCSSCTKRT